MPFYTAKSPRGESGHWIDCRNDQVAKVDPLSLLPNERGYFRWVGSEVIYTFWMKHIMCSDPYCFHLTPQANSSVVSEKALKLKAWLDCVCPKCGEAFDIEQAEFRMAPDAKLILGADVRPFAAIDVKSGTAKCPHCKKTIPADDINAIQRRKGTPISREIHHSLLLPKDWLRGLTAKSKEQYGGYHGASPEQDKAWFRDRSELLKLIEVRGSIPEAYLHSSFKKKAETGSSGGKAGPLICGGCGRAQDALTALRLSGRMAPVFPYLIAGFDPASKKAGYPYSGRFFALPDWNQILSSFVELATRSDLHLWIPSDALWFGHETHQRQLLPDHGYTHWYKMFNPRQMYILGLLAKTISDAPDEVASVSTKSQALGAFQNYLRNNCSFSFWNPQRDTPEPHFSNNNYHPKATWVENGVFSDLGRGNFASCIANVAEGMSFAKSPYDLRTSSDGEKAKSAKVASLDTIISDKVKLICGSSTDLRQHLTDSSIDLVITDPPFGDNVNYAEMADFFLVWLKKPLSILFPTVFTASESPKSQEAVTNKARQPGENEDGIKNADAMYDRLMTACWREAARILKPAGLMAFTFHHDDDVAWIGVLDSLFRAGFIIESAFPVRSDETKGDGDFGAKKIEFDIVHVCRKRLEEPKSIFWATLRKQIIESVKSNATILAQHRLSGLHLADLEVIIRGEVLEQYSKHYGKVKRNFAGDLISIREILLEANAIALSLLQKNETDRVPENIDPETRVLFTLLRDGPAIERDAATKRLKGSGVTLDDLERNGWIEVIRKDGERIAQIIHPSERWNSLSRKQSLKSDLDQAHFLINCCVEGRTFKDRPAVLEDWIFENYKTLLPSVGPILKFLETTHFGFDAGTKRMVGIANRTLDRALQRVRDTDHDFKKASDQMDLFELKEKGEV
jgi:putative DNA methylase